jgi:hypothetical protein
VESCAKRVYVADQGSLRFQIPNLRRKAPRHLRCVLVRASKAINVALAGASK